MHAKQIKKIYSEMSKKYNKIVLTEKYLAHKKIGLWVVKELNKKNAKILDLGCGTGQSSLEFFKRNYSVIGVDISEGMLEEAKKLPFKKLICQDLERPLKVKESFDAVVLVGALEFIKKPLRLFKQAHKHLTDDGVFALAVPKKVSKTLRAEIKSYYKKEIEPMFNMARFKVVKCEEFFAYNQKGETVKYDGYLLKKKV